MARVVPIPVEWFMNMNSVKYSPPSGPEAVFRWNKSGWHVDDAVVR